MCKPTFDKLWSAIEKIVEEHPDVVYPVDEDGGCYYSKGVCGDGDGCLIGQALQACGLDVTPLDSDTPSDICNIIREFELNYTEAQVGLLDELQYYQDIGTPWEDALAKAVEVYGSPQ